MASQLNLSQTQYMHIRKLLVPKHLEIGSLSRRKRMMRSKLQLEHANISIQRNMMKRLEPMREIETIMRHFDERVQERRSRQYSERIGSKYRRVTSVAHQDPDCLNIESKIRGLTSLPALKLLRNEAKTYQKSIHQQWLKSQNEQKDRILNSFKSYLHTQLKVHSQLERKTRAKTVI